MVYCVQAELGFDSNAKANQVNTAITTRISGKARWGADYLSIEPLERAPFGMVVMLRFVSDLDAHDLLTYVTNYLTGPRTPLAGSFVELHACPHDEGVPTPCVVNPADRVVW